MIEYGQLISTAALLAQRTYIFGKDILLTPKEFLPLSMLARAEGRYLTAVELYAKAWGLENHIPLIICVATPNT